MVKEIGMPDWLAHVLFAYVLCKVLGFKFKTFRRGEYVAIVMLGSLVPDVVKIGMLFDLFNIWIWDCIEPLHTPAGSLLVSALISLLFRDSIVFPLLVLGFATHYFLDFLMGHVSGGMLLLFPFSWNEYQLGLIHCDEYRVALIMSVLAILMYSITRRSR